MREIVSTPPIDITGLGPALAWFVGYMNMNAPARSALVRAVDWGTNAAWCDVKAFLAAAPSQPASTPWIMYGSDWSGKGLCPAIAEPSPTQAQFPGPAKLLCSRAVVTIHLPSYTNIETGTGAVPAAAWSAYCNNVLNFIQAFNAKYGEAAGVRFVSFSPTRVYVSDPAVPVAARLKQSQTALLALSRDVKQRNMGPEFKLGITQADSIVQQVPAIGQLNAKCIQANTPQFTIFNFDSEDPNVHSNLALALKQVGVAAVGKGIDTVTMAGSTSLTAQKLTEVFKLPSIEGVTFVGIPEIYDMAYAGCTFPPPLCSWSIDQGKTTQTNCDIPTVTADYIARGVVDLFTAKKCTSEVGINPTNAFLTQNTRYFQTWPGFSIQQPPACFKTPATITGMSQVGCSNFSTFTVQQFVEFARAFGDRTASERMARGISPYAAPVPIMLYEAAYIPLTWLKQLDVPFIPYN